MGELITLQSVRNEIDRCQDKLARLTRNKVSRRDEQYKYWSDRFKQFMALEAKLKSLRDCSKHQSGKVDFGKVIMGSGECHVRAACPVCGRNLNPNGAWVGNGIFPNDIFDELPIFEDYRVNNPTCEVCKAIGTELHHWAPKELFPDDFEKWPKSYLCPDCHRHWHSVVTNPFRQLRRKAETNGKDAT